MNNIFKFLYSMKFAIIILIVIGIYSFALVAFNEYYPAYTKEMFNEVVNSTKDIDAKYGKYIEGMDLSTGEKAEDAQLKFIRQTYYKDLHHWSDTKYFLINNLLQLFDQFKSFNYRALLALLTLSLLMCVISNTKRVVNKLFSSEFRSLKQIKESSHFVDLKEDEVLPNFDGYKKFTSFKDDEERFYYTKHRISFSGAYFVHIGLILLFIGGLFISLFGVRFYSTAWEHQNTLLTEKQKSKYDIDFDVVVNNYEVTYTDGKLLYTKEGYNFGGYGRKMIADFVSDLSVIKDGKEVDRKKIEVNSPLEHNGFTFYQTNSTLISESMMRSLGEQFFDKGKIDIHIDGKHNEIIARYREITPIKDSDYSILMEDFECGFFQIYNRDSKRYMRDQAVVVALIKGGEVVGRYKIYLDPEKRSETIKPYSSVDSISLLEIEPYYETGIEIATSPGSIFVWLGFILSSIGLLFSFYISYSEIYVAGKKDKKGNMRYSISVNSKYLNEKMLEYVKDRLGRK